MQEPTFLILTALAAGPQHGYGIITDVLQISGERVRLQAGTLYAALDRLQGEGMVETHREEVVDGRARRYYRLTPEGEARLAVEAEHLRRNADTAATRLRARLRPAFSMQSAVSRWEAGLATSFGSAR
ncbi:PadR family transcriptional regulator [Nonomuraea sp. NPDC004297]